MQGSVPPFALIIRGGCTFDDKVRYAQRAGFKAAIVYDDEDGGALISSNVPFLSPFLRIFSNFKAFSYSVHSKCMRAVSIRV